MNLKDLREIITMFEQADISELDLERQGVKIRLKKPTQSAADPETRLQMKAETVVSAPKEKEVEEKTVEIKAPMVGTFYISPTPDAALFVEEGDEISEGQVVCIIEAMKLMNEIKSEVSGRVKKVLVENGQAVEFNQPLFLVER